MPGKPAFHEDLSRGRDVEAGSDRSFGVVVGVVLAAVGVWPLWAGDEVRTWALLAAAAVLAVALARPSTLAPLNRAWFRFGLALGKVANPLAMGLVFYLTVTPTALIMRVLGKDTLRLKLDRGARSYWIERRPPGPPPETMRRQF